ncbi:MAG: family ATPase, partial [Pseudonocardiales bacterium]|nr:family ATPase [Pseudonocardiales bacterium]
RVGPMRDIVATIQPEQDELVRADLDESICVQGAPGTGKTAVGLHRAAYLLYLHRERLKRAGVLIVGPNRAFLHYIAAVLPALGELDVRQATVDDLIARVPIRGVDEPAAAAVKHDARMADVLAKALRASIREPVEPLMVPDGSYRWRISTDALRRIVDEVRREAPPYGIGRERVRARVVALLIRQAEYASGESPGEAWQRRMGRAKPVTGFLDAVWPAITAEQLVFDVLCDPDPDDRVLTEAERNTIRWDKPPRSVRSVRWAAAEAVLLDEAAGLIDRVPSFGHVVIDEAQDLSPMQCRAIARRSEHGSITLLGDLAQGTAPWAARAWRDTLAHLGKPDARVVALRTGFRVPEVVLELANRLLPALDVDVPEAVSLRRDGELRVREVADLESATVAAVRAACGFDGSVGVVAADAAVPHLLAALAEAGVTAGGPDDDELVTVMPATLTKGLEYDHVIVVEPADIEAAEPRGLHPLYVVLTRAVSRLDVLHHAPLPAAVDARGYKEDFIEVSRRMPG